MKEVSFIILVFGRQEESDSIRGNEARVVPSFFLNSIRIFRLFTSDGRRIDGGVATLSFGKLGN